MDFQQFADGFRNDTCVISVEKKEDIGHGDIRIVAVNKGFFDVLRNLLKKAVSSDFEFVPDSLYDRYLPRSSSFEDICCRAALAKKPVHTYVHIGDPDIWLNIFLMPIEYDDPCRAYCSYTIEATELAGIDLISTHSPETSADVLRTCIKLRETDDFKKTMKEVIGDIRRICDAAVCTLMLINPTDGTCSVLATDIREGSTLKRVTQFVNFYDIANSWLETIGDNDCLIIKSEEDMKYISEVNNPWYLTLEEAGVDSVVMFPLRYNSEVLGFIWATNFDTRYTMRIKETLELTTFFISSEIASYKMVRSLEMISYTDMLTGVRNRNAMNNRVSDIISGKHLMDKPYGVVFADLNGLKNVNDSGGHSAGDLLLKKAAIVLQEIFPGKEIYRAGGDEFMVIVTDCTNDELGEMVAKLRRRNSAPENVCFAVGGCFCGKGMDICKAMQMADQRMYKDKQNYYASHPEERRDLRRR